VLFFFCGLCFFLFFLVGVCFCFFLLFFFVFFFFFFFVGGFVFFFCWFCCFAPPDRNSFLLPTLPLSCGSVLQWRGFSAFSPQLSLTKLSMVQSSPYVLSPKKPKPPSILLLLSQKGTSVAYEILLAMARLVVLIRFPVTLSTVRTESSRG